jgi:hypothetical protein
MCQDQAQKARKIGLLRMVIPPPQPCNGHGANNVLQNLARMPAIGDKADRGTARMGTCLLTWIRLGKCFVMSEENEAESTWGC